MLKTELCCRKGPGGIDVLLKAGQHERAQKNTFTKWINYQLETHSSSGQVKDLFEDLRDGVLLCHLVEVLTGEALQVKKGRVSKRVHHISNLTTALSTLRRRGVKLVNNNPADIADGNPHVTMNLIWQIILYFQIENNVQLLREWGFELDGSGSSTSGITDETGACNNSSILNDQIHIGHIKVPIEKVFLRWINAQVSKTYGITVHDMDSFWKDGVVFNALIHKVRPDLVDMDEVCNSEPKQNLERAFRLARDHLHIHPLLEIDDMLIDMPDKRSVMAYVSQFIRLPSMCKPVSAESCCDLQSLSTWLHKAYSTLTKSSDESLYDRYQIYLTLRKEFVDHQHNYYLSRKEFPTSSSHHCYIENTWTKVGELLSKWSHRLEDELPGSLSDLSQWLCAAEQTISRPFELVAEDADHSLVRIKEAQETIKKLSVDYSQSYEKFQTIYFNKRVGDKEISIEFLEPLKIRFDALGRGIADLLKDLDVSHSYYLVFAFIEQLNKKMAFWKSGDSANLVKRWIKEYKVECNTFPEKKLHAFIENFAIVISSVSDESKEWLLVKCKEASKECIKNFNEFGRYLDSLLTYWKEFELYTSKVEEVVSKSEREKRNLLGADINDLLRKCGKARDAISRMSSASGRNAVNMRLASLRQRVDEIGRTPLCTEEKVNTKVVVPQSRSPWKSLIKLRSDRPSTSKVLRSSTPVHMMEWIKSVKELLSSTVSSLDQLDFLMQKLVEYQKEMHAVESERIALLKSAGHNQQNITEFRKLKNDLRVRSQQLKIVRPIFVEFEKSYNNLSDLVVHPKQSNKKQKECLEKINFMERMYLNSLCQDDYSAWIDSNTLRLRLSNLRDRFLDIEQEAKQGSIQKESSKPACDANNISKRKMEFFSRLERLRDNIVELRDQNAQWNTIYLSQIDEVSECLDELLTRAKDSLTLEAKSLCDEIETIRASFFQLECNRIKERFRMLLLQLEQIVELMTARKRLILKVEEFKKFLDERGGTVCVVGTDVLDHDGVYLEKTREGVAYNEMLAFEETLGAFQRDAQMIIVDLASLNIFETFPVSSSCKPKERPTFISQNFQEFINKTEEFESLLLSFCKTAVSNDSTIQESMERKRAENFYELEKMADTLDGDERRKAVERLKKLSLAAFGSSNDSLEFKIMQLNARHNFIDGSIKKCIQNFDIKKVEEIEKKLWTPWKIELSELEKSVTGNETIQKHFGALEKLAFELDGRICRFKHAVSKRQRREENLFKKLNLFATWLNLVEREVMNLNLLSDSQENNVQQKNKLVGSIALHQQLVLKLERTCFLFNQRAEIRDYCKRYWDLVSKISQWSVPNTKLLQTCFDAEIPSTSKDSEAALNFPTASSTDEDYDSDIRSIEKELYIGELSSSPLQNTNLFMKVTQAYHEGDIEVLLPEIDDEIAGISNRLGVIKCSYAKRLKRLEEASDDYKRLLDIQKCHTDLEVICRILSTRVAGDTATKLWTFFCHLLRTSPFINDQIIVLKREIDDETDLRSNYGNVLAYFKKLRAYAGIPKNNITLVKGMIDEIGLQLSCFCKQYFARRKYVENSIKVLAASNDGKMSPWEEIVSLTSGAIMPVVEALDEELDKTLKEDKKDELVALRSKLQQLLNNVNERYGCDSTEDVLDETEKAKDNVKAFENRNQEEADQYLKKASEHPCITTCVKFVENHIIEATKCLITKIEQLLCDKSTTIEALLQTLGEIDSLLSYCGHLQQDDLTESLPQELYTLSSKLELLKKKLKERCDTWDAFKFECDSLNNILNEVRQTLKPVREDSHITMEEEIHNRLATCSQHIQGLEGNLKRIQQFAESLAPMETASKEVSRIKNDYDEVYNDLLDTKTKAVRKTKEQNTQKIKEPQSAHSKETKNAIADKSKEVEEKEAVRSKMKNLADEQDGVNALVDVQTAICCSDDVAKATETLKAIEEAELRLHKLAEDLKYTEFGGLDEDDMAMFKRKAEEAEGGVDRLKAAAEKLRLYIETLNIWENDKHALREMVKPDIAKADELRSRYATAQPYETAATDVKIVEELAERLLSAQKKVKDAATSLRSSIPECEAVLNEADTFADELMKKAADLQELLRLLNEDLSIQNQLVDENAEITKQLNSLCERLESGGDTDDIAFDAMHNELNYIAKEADEFAKRFAEPVRYVLHSVEFSAPEINAKIASTKAEIDSKRARVAADDELKKLQSDISAEMTILEIAVNDGQKVISDDAADLANIDSALQQIRSAMEHLNLAENSYRRMSELPDADAVCSDVLDKLSKYGDELGTLETALVDRQTNLTNFNATALNVKQQLNALENSCNEVEAANVESGLANCDTLAKNLDEVRDNLKELKNEADDLGELKAPNELAESLKEIFDALEERLNKAKDNLLKQKSVEDNVDHELNVAQEELEAFEAKYESPKELATAVEDLKQLNELNVRIGEINVDDVVDRQKQNRFTKRRDELKCLLEELLTPLEKDVAGEQDILAELHNLLAELNSISDKAMAIEGSSDGNGEELANLSKLGDEFDALKNRVEVLKEKMAFPEGKVQHTLLYGDLLERIMCLERALDLGSETSSSERCCSVGFASPCGSGCAGSVDVKDSPSDVNVSDGDVVNVDGAVESDVEGESVTLSFESDESVSDAVEAVDSGFGRSRWRRVLRAALPLQAMLVLLLGAACLVPHCDDEYCCQLLNNFAHSLDPSLHFIDGPPPI